MRPCPHWGWYYYVKYMMEENWWKKIDAERDWIGSFLWGCSDIRAQNTPDMLPHGSSGIIHSVWSLPGFLSWLACFLWSFLKMRGLWAWPCYSSIAASRTGPASQAFKSIHMWAENFQMYRLGLEKAEEPKSKLPTISILSQSCGFFSSHVQI